MFYYYTDGACSGNPGPGGWAVVKTETAAKSPIVSYTMFCGNEENTTNNRMEMLGMVAALEDAAQYSTDNYIIYTDSAYIHNCITNKWYKTWLDNGWKTSSGAEVKNQELWKRLLNLNIEQATLIKVKGHADTAGNALADKYAVQARKNKIEGRYEH